MSEFSRIADVVVMRLRERIPISDTVAERLREVLLSVFEELGWVSSELDTHLDATVLVALRPGLLRLLEILKKVPKPMYTKQLRYHLHEGGYGQDLIYIAEALGLIKRIETRCRHDHDRICIYNVLTALGEKALESIRRAVQLEEIAKKKIKNKRRKTALAKVIG